MSKTKKVKLGTAKERADHRANVAIKKEVAGRNVFLGRERNARSRKYRHKLFSTKPVDLTAAVKELERSKTKQEKTNENNN
jgi:hypothetical protein